mmetsp:Transcript_50631/g.154019  ORF Transcript_50631/g.154019 Transcript_50631/m.154019 type:complete len:221 (-) Transcript_50631:72-734(-)
MPDNSSSNRLVAASKKSIWSLVRGNLPFVSSSNTMSTCSCNFSLSRLLKALRRSPKPVQRAINARLRTTSAAIIFCCTPSGRRPARPAPPSPFPFRLSASDPGTLPPSHGDAGAPPAAPLAPRRPSKLCADAGPLFGMSQSRLAPCAPSEWCATSASAALRGCAPWAPAHAPTDSQSRAASSASSAASVAAHGSARATATAAPHNASAMAKGAGGRSAGG